MPQMIPEDELMPLSALQHAVFCRRQCALIHMESVWTENALTAAGRVLHERVDRREHETRRDVRLATALRLVSRRLGVAGVADRVEFRRVGDDDPAGAALPNAPGRWAPFPVEYKRGRPKSHRADEVQLCAQAMCLEEMLEVVRQLLAAGVVPPAEHGKWCESCSLADDCRPRSQGRSARAWLARRLEEIEA